MTGPRRVADLSEPGQKLARLVPQIYLSRDAAIADRPLLRLLDVLAGPLADLEAAAATALDDHFVERARGSVLRLLAELVGARLLGTDERTNRGVVAATVRWRRRKGTMATLEEVLRTTTGWATEVDEASRSLLATQDLDDQLPFRGATTDLGDPIALADPLSRRERAGSPEGPASDTGAEMDVRGQLRRLGAADALRPAVSPRTLDLDGWVRPERVVVRTSRLLAREVDQQEVVHVVPVAHRDDPAGTPQRFVGVSLDPRGVQLDQQGRPVPFPLAGVRVSGERPVAVPSGLSEPDGAGPNGAGRLVVDVLSPTALAMDTAAADHDLLTLFVDDVTLVGGRDAGPVPQPLPYQPPGVLAVLRFADARRPSPGERWQLDLAALDRLAAVAAGPADPSAPPATEAGADNPVVLRATVGPGDPGTATVTSAGGLDRAGARLALRVQRLRGAGYQRGTGPGRDWTVMAGPTLRGRPVGPVVEVTGLPEVLLVRVERGEETGLDLARLRPDAVTPAWDLVPLDLPGLALDRLGDVADEGALLVAAGGDDVVLVAGPADHGDATALGVWRVDAPGAAAGPGAALAGTRLDGGGAAPAERVLAAACLAGGVLWLAGGQDRRAATPAILADLWSIPVALGPPRAWTRHRTRHAPARVGARLLASAGALVLVGGADRPGELAGTVHTVDPAAARPVWTDLPPLPVEVGRPGVLWARHDGPDLEVVAWADRSRPRTLRLVAGERAWTDAGLDAGTPPNPPADDAAVFAGARLVVAGPVPLPPSEVVLSVAGRGHLAFLPALDPPDGGVDLLLLETDGSTARWLPPGTGRDVDLRLGAGREEPYLRRTAPGSRIGVPGRLGWRPLGLRQHSLGPWDGPLALDLDGVVGLDPRLGRVLVPREVVAGGRLSASYRIGRAEAIGAGFAPAARAIPDDWQEPPDPVDPARFVPALAPDVDPSLPGGPVAPTALLLPVRAGETIAGVPCVARPQDGVLADAPLIGLGRRAHVITVPGSPRLEPATLTIAEGDVLSMSGAAAGAVAHVAAEDGVSLRLQERLAAGERPDAGPRWFLSGLSTDGAVEVLVTAGLVDIRWCDLAPPRRDDAAPRTGVRVAGAGSASMPWRPPPVIGSGDPDEVGAGAAGSSLTIRLIGCLVGRLEVPSWARVIAAGCTFDAGSGGFDGAGGEAISAAGATLRLRHCTVRGAVRAGVLQASSCLLRGRVECDDADHSWLRHSGIDASTGTGSGFAAPVRYACVEGPIDLAATSATDPRYLVPTDANRPSLLTIGERGLQPGAHGRRARGLSELTGRTTDFLPLGLVPHHLDRAAADVWRMNRRLV